MQIRVPASAPLKTRMGIQQALEWAFGRECARLDLDVVDPENAARPGVGAEWLIYQRFLLGATIESSGRGWGGSAPHHDAEVIAAFVANLGPEHGGRGMARRIAELARAGITPDWMPGGPRCAPVHWAGENQHGRYAATEVIDRIEVTRRGRRVMEDVTWCPVRYTPTAAHVAAARRGYLAWWGALLSLAADLGACGMLSRVEITDVMPPMTPWRARA